MSILTAILLTAVPQNGHGTVIIEHLRGVLEIAKLENGEYIKEHVLKPKRSNPKALFILLAS